uniref:Uncharacterized protein n=1 Tax=Branchiostoma floridae TaxID=7739 RepID=C3ZNH5_BRAFL|eukprot:XP_002589917.1 hypothetical protein BRAFLDRAFT_81955 [Branchiostoma floridae]
MMLGFGVTLLLQGLAAVLLGISAEYLHKSRFHGLLAPVWSGCMAIATGLLAICSGKTPNHKWLRHWTHALSFVTSLIAIAALIIGVMGVTVTCSDDVTNIHPAYPCGERRALHVTALCLALGTLVAAMALFITCCSYYVTCPSCDVTCPTCDVSCPTSNVLCNCCRTLREPRRRKTPPVGAPLPSRSDPGEDTVQQEMSEHAHENPYVFPDDPPPYYIPDVQVEIDEFEMLEMYEKEVKKTVRFKDQDQSAI